jgi:hypothetical protein
LSTLFEEIFYKIFNLQQERRNCDKSADHQQCAEVVIDKTFKHGVISFSVYSFIINYFLKIVNTFFSWHADKRCLQWQRLLVCRACMQVSGSADPARLGPLSQKKLPYMLAWRTRPPQPLAIVGGAPAHKKSPFLGAL